MAQIKKPVVKATTAAKTLKATTGKESPKKITPKAKAKIYTLKKPEPKIITTTKTTKPTPKATPKKSQPNNNFITKIREDWSKPKPTWIDGKGLRDAEYDKYPYGSLTGRGKNNKNKR